MTWHERHDFVASSKRTSCHLSTVFSPSLRNFTSKGYVVFVPREEAGKETLAATRNLDDSRGARLAHPTPDLACNNTRQGRNGPHSGGLAWSLPVFRCECDLAGIPPYIRCTGQPLPEALTTIGREVEARALGIEEAHTEVASLVHRVHVPRQAGAHRHPGGEGATESTGRHVVGSSTVQGEL